jgi:hypothetical protein
MVEVNVNPGICGLNTLIKVDSDDMQNASVETISDCPYIKKIGQELTEVDGYEECFSKFGESMIYSLSKKYCKHVACPVPSAILKGVEVACGLALPKDVEIKISKI